MAIWRGFRLFRSIVWLQVSATIGLRRVGGSCERCQRRHGQNFYHLGDGRWWDMAVFAWRGDDDEILRVQPMEEDLGPIAVTRVRLTVTRRNRDPRADGVIVCQHCRRLRDRAEPWGSRRRKLFRREALGDLFQRCYLSRSQAVTDAS
ncbi:hypothetical protein [Methylobacterium sp. UNC300MFChir4.1]|uniref:hypothetical protein n=1 Tax=Methylobacterium sp. UNC300MFChir4.1 TaxID=1502747 RepID=UPI00111443C3|nr:hypothetical protein [Methylobacterium sp. UNC300MFChir4.1]